MLKVIIGFFAFLFLTGCSDTKQEAVIESYSSELTNTLFAFDINRTAYVYANYSDGSRVDISSNLLWDSSDEALISVSKNRLSSKNIEGDVNISAKTVEKLSSGVSIYTHIFELSVQDIALNRLEISPSLPFKIAVLTSTDLKAFAYYDDNTTLHDDVSSDAKWYSTNETVATVKSGNLQALQEGNTTIYTTYKDKNSSVLEVEVTRVHYKSIEIYTSKSSFNVEQSIELEAKATTADNTIVILNATDINWNSSDTDVITIDNSAIIRAISLGSADINATLKSDENISTLKKFTVLKENYMRLFDSSGSELEFETPITHNFDSQNDDSNLSTFSMQVVGDRSYKITLLAVTDMNTTSLDSNYYIDILDENRLYTKDDKEIKFFLIHAGGEKKLRYSFKINDGVSSSIFTQNYVDND